jgi:hypothetical protein
MTITEALGKIKTIDARIEKKKQVVMEHLLRPAALVDPLEAQGGQAKLVAGEMQAMRDLLEYKLAIKKAINEVNLEQELGVGELTMTISEWLVWKRDVAPLWIDVLQGMLRKISSERNEFSRRMAATPGQQSLIVNTDEAELSRRLESIVQTFGEMDGQLSLRNATVFCDVEYQVVE